LKALPWQLGQARGVEERLAAGRLPHALLVTAPEGWGDGVFADWLALTLLGVDEAREAATLAHPDLRWLVPEGAVIKVDAVRELVGFAQGTPQAGPRKVAVITDAHYLNRNAANALLKTLEEPPPGTHLILSSCHPGRLLPTIRSRCQALAIPPDRAEARRWLEAQTDAPDLDQRLFEHGGAPVAVLDGLAVGEPLLEPLLTRALEPGAVSEVAGSLLEPNLADALGRWYRYVLALAAGEWHAKELGALPGRAVMAFADELTWARRQLVSSNSANERLLAERMVARWRSLAARQS
jgi:DNA polymerase-3 subunit delta'